MDLVHQRLPLTFGCSSSAGFFFSYLTLTPWGWMAHTIKCDFLFSVISSVALFSKLPASPAQLAAFPFFLEVWASYHGLIMLIFSIIGLWASSSAGLGLLLSNPLPRMSPLLPIPFPSVAVTDLLQLSCEPLISFSSSITCGRLTSLRLSWENIWHEASRLFLSSSSLPSEAFRAQCVPPWRTPQHGCPPAFVIATPPVSAQNQQKLLPCPQKVSLQIFKTGHLDFVCP